MKLEGRVALVTGAGSGMGRAMVRRFYDEGATVVAVDIRPDAVKETIAENVWPDDLAIDEERVLGDVVARFGRLDVLCNNAGVLDDYTPAGETSLELWHRVIGVNLTGPFLWSRAAVPQMTNIAVLSGEQVANIGSQTILDLNGKEDDKEIQSRCLDADHRVGPYLEPHADSTGTRRDHRVHSDRCCPYLPSGTNSGSSA